MARKFSAKSEIWWEFGVLSKEIKKINKSIILDNNNAKRLLKNWKKISNK